MTLTTMGDLNPAEQSHEPITATISVPTQESAPPLSPEVTAAASTQATETRAGSGYTLLSAFAPAVNQAMAAASAEGSTVDGGGGAAATLGTPGRENAAPMPVLLWDQTSPSGRVTGRPHTVQSLERVEEDDAAQWWS
ncbi:hypothetical protein Vretifemale_17709 [Volvox reticuliferus]|uniref:Uncharacterized protein n=1 Tax=Volvox reticuliferus TaxID=1737510 RepID=A0A8J4FUV2_9CHLO|nr:hypothetical protein Vretifemale_17709 [Volvox reticuliferus]